ncbi:MAG: hypothetical protein F4Y39_24795 [Gemmatimonadetes bacterium]|nr:hypothetical protein [Gemmatimonadota bacterium]MYF79167.1 hypothetical protein [Chloroflexota bacterium]
MNEIELKILRGDILRCVNILAPGVGVPVGGLTLKKTLDQSGYASLSQEAVLAECRYLADPLLGFLDISYPAVMKITTYLVTLRAAGKDIIDGTCTNESVTIPENE